MPTKISKVAINSGSGFSEFYMPTHADLVEGLPSFIDGRLEVARANLRSDGSITLSPSSVSMSLDNNVSTVTVTSAGDGALSATSDDESVVIPHISGGTLTLTAIGAGTATITIIAAQTSSYNEARGYLTVNVAKGSPQLNLSFYSLELDSTNLADAVIVSRNGTGEFSAASSNTSVATVSVSGTTVTITAEGNGEATITVTVAGTSTHLSGTATIAVTCNLIDSTMENNSTANIIAAIQAGKGRDISGM